MGCPSRYLCALRSASGSVQSSTGMLHPKQRRAMPLGSGKWIHADWICEWSDFEPCWTEADQVVLVAGLRADSAQFQFTMGGFPRGSPSFVRFFFFSRPGDGLAFRFAGIARGGSAGGSVGSGATTGGAAGGSTGRFASAPPEPPPDPEPAADGGAGSTASEWTSAAVGSGRPTAGSASGERSVSSQPGTLANDSDNARRTAGRVSAGPRGGRDGRGSSS